MIDEQSREYELGKWVESAGKKLLIKRGNKLLEDNSDTRRDLPDQSWLLKDGITKAYFEFKAFSCPDFFRIAGKYQIGISQNQFRRYMNQFKRNPSEPILYALWVGKHNNETGKMYVISIEALDGTEHHSSSEFDTTNKLGKLNLFYNMDYIKDNSMVVFDLPLSKSMLFNSYVKTGDSKRIKEQVSFG